MVADKNRKKWSYIWKIAIVWGIVFSIFSFLLSILLGNIEFEKSIVFESIIHFVARFIVGTPFGLILGSILWKNKLSMINKKTFYTNHIKRH